MFEMFGALAAISALAFAVFLAKELKDLERRVGEENQKAETKRHVVERLRDESLEENRKMKQDLEDLKAQVQQQAAVLVCREDLDTTLLPIRNRILAVQESVVKVSTTPAPVPGISQEQEDDLRNFLTAKLDFEIGKLRLDLSDRIRKIEEDIEEWKETAKAASVQNTALTTNLEARLQQISDSIASFETTQSAALRRIATLEEDFLDRQNRAASELARVGDTNSSSDDDSSSSSESSEDEEEIDALLAEGTATMSRQTTPSVVPVVTPDNTPIVAPGSTRSITPGPSPDPVRRGASNSQIDVRRSPIVLRRRKPGEEEEGTPPHEKRFRSGSIVALDDSLEELSSPVPTLNLAAIPGFTSPMQSKLKRVVVSSPQMSEVALPEAAGVKTTPLFELRRTRSVSTSARPRPRSADETCLTSSPGINSNMSVYSGLLMSASNNQSNSPNGLSNDTLLPLRSSTTQATALHKIQFTEEELSSKKGKLRKVWEMIQEKEMMLLEKEKQLMLVEKDQMMSLHEIDSTELVICEELGRGASAVVNRGFWNGTIVAIKAMKKISLLNDEAIDLFFREIELLSSLRHPNIIQYFGASVAEDQVLMVIEYLPKGTLFELLHQNKEEIGIRDLHKIARGVACGMAYLHTMSPPVIHLDLKSQNILLGPDLHPKVSDFGLSKLVNEGGLRIGTPQWTAPEVFGAADESLITPKADVYSFGIVLNEMITRQIPWRKQPRETVPVLVSKKQLRPEIADSASPALVALVRQCWSQEPHDRPSFDQVLSALDKFEATLTEDGPRRENTGSRAARKKRLQSVISQIVKKNFEDVFEVISEEEIYNGAVEARNRLTNDKVAVKKAEKNSSNSDKDGNLRSLTVEDVTLLKTFDHPHIIKLYDVYEDPTTIYLVMELLPLADELFMQLVDVGQYPELYAQTIIKQVIKALDYLHANAVAHGALRPENILCSGSDENVVVKLTNFGFSKLFEQERDIDGAAYQPPEVISSEAWEILRFDPSMDVWSLGVLTYALLSGLPPFCSDDPEELAALINNVQYDFSDFDPWETVSEHAKDFISKLLVKDPTKRMTIQQCKAHPWIKSYKPERPNPGFLTARRVEKDGTTPREALLTARRMEKEKEKEKAEKEKMVFKDNIESFLTFGTELGSGAYSIVLRAEAKNSNDVFAVKCIDKHRLLSSEEGEDLMKFLKREIAIMKRVDHPNIIKLYDVYTNEKQFYLVLEYVPDAQELFEKVIAKGRYLENEAVNVVRQVVLAIDYLHSNGIAHRDLKPENLISSGDGENEIIKLMDFGFSKNYHGESELRTAVGSPAYAAPELFEEVPSYDKSVDMWAVGVITYVLLSGSPPFYGNTLMELLDKVISVDYEFDGEVWEEVSEEAKDFISLLLVKDPSHRMTARQCKAHSWLRGTME